MVMLVLDFFFRRRIRYRIQGNDVDPIATSRAFRASSESCDWILTSKQTIQNTFLKEKKTNLSFQLVFIMSSSLFLIASLIITSALLKRASWTGHFRPYLPPLVEELSKTERRKCSNKS